MSDPISTHPSHASISLAAKRPIGLTVICVLAIVLGALGILGSIPALIMQACQLFGVKIHKMFVPQSSGGSNDDFVELSQKINDQMFAVAEKYALVSIVFSLVFLAIAIALIFGGVQTLKLKPLGRTILMTACMAAILLDITSGVVQYFIAIENIAAIKVTKDQWNEGEGSDQRGNSQQKLFLEMMSMSMVLGLIGPIVIMLIKFSFYAASIYYLSKSRVQSLFYSTLSGGVA